MAPTPPRSSLRHLASAASSLARRGAATASSALSLAAGAWRAADAAHGWRWLLGGYAPARRLASGVGASHRRVVVLGGTAGSGAALSSAVAAGPAAAFADNVVRNTKYTAWSFLPLFLAEQFGAPMNLYFLIIACLQLWRAITPVSPVTTWAPLLAVMAVAAVKEALEDRARAAADAAATGARFDVWRDGVRVESGGGGGLGGARGGGLATAASIRVGDIVRVPDDAEAPCDLLLLKAGLVDRGASARRSVAYLETSNLDGETNLKLKEGVRCSVEAAGAGEGGAARLRGAIAYEGPNDDIHKFNGSLSLSPSSPAAAATPARGGAGVAPSWSTKRVGAVSG